MSSIYRPDLQNSNRGALQVLPDNLPLQKTGQVSTSCDGCTSIYETMKNRSDFDKMYIPIYQSRLALFDTNPLNLRFER